MNTRLFQVLSVAILATFSVTSFSQSAVPFAIDPSALVFETPTAPVSQKAKIAILLPEVGSPYEAINASLVQGIEAENKQNGSPYEILPLPRKWGQSALSHLQDAALMGAVIAIGPLTRDSVDEIAQLPFLPLPTVALNQFSDGLVAPELLMNYSLSQEQEVAQITKIALSALPQTTSSGEPPKVMIFESDSPLEKRIANAYEQELVNNLVPYERVVLTPELMKTQTHFYEIKSDLKPPKLEPLPDRVEDPYGYQRVRLRNQKLMAEYRSAAVFEEPPYFAAFLAMDARTAAQITPRLPRMTRLWGTSLLNPGDPHQGTVTAMTYDLQNVGFVDAPLVLKNNASDFRASFGVTMPARIVERRFFSMGVDAYRLALRWVKWQTQIEFEGTTGKLSFNQLESSTVQRTAQPALIESNKIRAVTEERLKNIRIRPIAP